MRAALVILICGLCVVSPACPASAAAGVAVSGDEIAPGDSSLVLLPVVQPDSTVSYVAPVLDVRARRLSREEVLDRAGGFSSVIHASSWAGGIESAAAVLAEAAGTHVSEAGGIGGYSSVSLRGSSAAQVPVYLDGIPLASMESGAVNLADVPLGALERIEVYRGAAPLVLGGASLGGAIHLVSASARQAPWLQMASGSHGSYTLEAGASHEQREWLLGARARYIRSEGDWGYLFDNRTIYNTKDDFETARVNNDVRGGGVLLSARRPLGEWRIGLSALIDGREQGIPGRAGQAENARGSSLARHFRAALEPLRRHDGVVRRIEIFDRIDRQGFDDVDGELGLGSGIRTDHVHSAGTHLVGAFKTGSEDAWRLEARWARLRSEIEEPIAETGSPQTRWSFAAALQPQWRVFGGRLVLSPGARVELHQDRFHGIPPFGNYELPDGPQQEAETWAHTGQVGARYLLGDELVLKANVGRYDRVPTLLERFGHRGTVIGNPDLMPESGTNRDIGLVWTRPREGRRLMFSLFHNDSSDLIAFVRNSQQTARAVNIGAAEVKGIELDFDSGELGAMRYGWRLTTMSSRDRSDNATHHGQPLPGRPSYELGARLAWTPGPMTLGYGLSAMGKNTLEQSGRERIPARVLHSVSLRADLAGVTLDARVDNLADDDEIFDLYGWPLPGRRFSLALRMGGEDARSQR